MSKDSPCWDCDHNLFSIRCGMFHHDLYKKSFDYHNCPDFELPDFGDEPDEDSEEFSSTAVCPHCDNDEAYWDGDSYVCDNCGHVFR